MINLSCNQSDYRIARKSVLDDTVGQTPDKISLRPRWSQKLAQGQHAGHQQVEHQPVKPGFERELLITSYYRFILSLLGSFASWNKSVLLTLESIGLNTLNARNCTSHCDLCSKGARRRTSAAQFKVMRVTRA